MFYKDWNLAIIDTYFNGYQNYSLNFPEDRWILFINGEDEGFYQSTALRALNGKFSGADDLPMVFRLGISKSQHKTCI